jgi:hypothetical protein
MADNSSRKFKFISPGVFVNEIDNSEVPAQPGAVGPVVIGQSQKGPGMEPVTIQSFSEFVDVFGEPIAGNEGNDIWRDRSRISPTYAAYAAQAWLKNSSPLTFVRLLGEQDSSATSADLEAGGYAGWEAGQMDGVNAASPISGGAWGLCIWPSGSGVLTGTHQVASTITGAAPTTGAVAAVIYVNKGRLLLSGNYALGEQTSGGTPAYTASNCQVIESDANGNLTLMVSREGTALNDTVSISLNPSSPNFIRNVLNTDPTITNTAITSDSTRSSSLGGNFWVGETYERSLNQRGTTSLGVLDFASTTANTSYVSTRFYAALMPLRNQKDTTQTLNDNRYAATKPSTGWFLAQDLSSNTASYSATNTQKLFRCEALTAGEETQQTVKISIINLSYAQGAFEDYGTFSLLVRSITDTDNEPVILERYDSLNLNPASPNYIARVIGDKYQEYDSVTKTNRDYGQYTNRSRFIRICMDEDISRGGAEPALLPFGMYGPLRYRSVVTLSGAAGFGNPSIVYGSSSVATVELPVAATASAMIDGGNTTVFGGMGGNNPLIMGSGALGVVTYAGLSSSWSGSLEYPSVPLRQGSTWSFPKSNNNIFWGAWTGLTVNDPTFNASIVDMIRARSRGLQGSPYTTTRDVGKSWVLSGSDPSQIAWVFSLDDISGSSNGTFAYVSGSRQAGLSRTAASATYKAIIDAGQNQFTTLLHGGTDGFDITERDPFRNSKITDSSTDLNSSVLHSLKRAANIVADAEQVQCNLMAMPGVTNNLATNHLLDIAEARGDTLAVIDIPKVYTADTENSASEKSRNSFTVKQAVDDLKGRNINNSYGATYYPWVQVQDTITNRVLWAPPSIAALGALSHTDKIAAPWYAPAGFTRGGLSEGAGGIPILDTSRRLTSDDRDELYAAGINPIAKFPAEGIVVFGQKTLQQTASALDRINVRRLLIFLKREMSFIASRLLFAPNTRDTWTRFTQQATPVLDSVKSQFGISDFRLILDETTTTPDLVDRNIIYAKLIVKPTRSAEFFAIDFVVTNSGASFED